MEQFERFVHDYMGREFGTTEYVLHSGKSLFAFPLLGFTCMAQDKDPCGYEIALFTGPDSEATVVAFFDIMSSTWMICSNVKPE